MKYIIVAAGLLFSLNAFALFSGDNNDSSDSSSTNKLRVKDRDDDTTKGFSRPMCQSFCDKYKAKVQVCDVSIDGSDHWYEAPSAQGNAAAGGNSLSVTYKIECGPTE